MNSKKGIYIYMLQTHEHMFPIYPEVFVFHFMMTQAFVLLVSPHALQYVLYFSNSVSSLTVQLQPEYSCISLIKLHKGTGRYWSHMSQVFLCFFLKKKDTQQTSVVLSVILFLAEGLFPPSSGPLHFWKNIFFLELTLLFRLFCVTHTLFV